ncbi:MAG: tripartite tricarboxylate transporter substrate-binding protein [Xanthobacteraceae bacterium]
MAEALGKELGQSVVVENRAGATGVIGLEQLQRSAPDGYTMALFISSTAIAHIAQNRKFDLAKQMLPLGSLVTSPVILCVNPAMVDVKNLDELIAWLRKHPDTPYVTSGSGSPAHLNTEALARKLDLKLNHIAYRGMGPAQWIFSAAVSASCFPRRLRSSRTLKPENCARSRCSPEIGCRSFRTYRRRRSKAIATWMSRRIRD